jgi:hypothetical protein
MNDDARNHEREEKRIWLSKDEAYSALYKESVRTVL